jgi:hypothetical protein
MARKRVVKQRRISETDRLSAKNTKCLLTYAIAVVKS